MVICPSTVVPAGTLQGSCGLLSWLLNPPLPAHVEVRPTGVYSPVRGGARVDCALVEGGCVIGVFQPGSGSAVATQEAYVPVAFRPAVPFTVRAGITNRLGETTDCTVAPEACVVALVRLERDGRLSHHLQRRASGPDLGLRMSM